MAVAATAPALPVRRRLPIELLGGWEVGLIVFLVLLYLVGVYINPRRLVADLSAGWDLYGYRYDFTQYAGYVTSSIGGDVHVGFPLSPYLTMQARYALHTDSVAVSSVQCGATPTLSTLICDQQGTTLTAAPGYTLRLDRRNDYQNPTRGFDVSFSQDFAGLGGAVDRSHRLLSDRNEAFERLARLFDAPFGKIT